MGVELLIHLELVPAGHPRFVWWAESPQLPGFSAAADHLPDLLRRAYAAVPEVLAEDGDDPGAIDIVPLLASSREKVGTTGEQVQDRSAARSPEPRSVVLTAI
jgi:hypothetical protein